MILRRGDIQEVPGVGVFEWDGHGFWVFGDVKRTHGELYFMLRDVGKSFDTIFKNDGKD